MDFKVRQFQLYFQSLKEVQGKIVRQFKVTFLPLSSPFSSPSWIAPFVIFPDFSYSCRRQKLVLNIRFVCFIPILNKGISLSQTDSCHCIFFLEQYLFLDQKKISQNFIFSLCCCLCKYLIGMFVKKTFSNRKLHNTQSPLCPSSSFLH